MNSIIKSYKLLILLSLLIFALGLGYEVISERADMTEQAVDRLQAETAKYQTTQIRSRLDALSNALRPMNVPYTDKKEAKKIVIAMADMLRTMYGATLDSDVAENNSAISASVTFSVLPSDPEQLIRLTDLLQSSTAPLMRIDRLEFTKQHGTHTAKFTVTITQPFTGGQYVY